MKKSLSDAAGKRLFLWFAVSILAVESLLIWHHYDGLFDIIQHYFWIAPLMFFKSWFKKLLVLNVFGLFKILLTLLWHIFKLLLIKLLKTVGIRYSTYFSQQKWQKLSQQFRIIMKWLTGKLRRFRAFMLSFSRVEFVLIVVAFLPLFLFLFLFGVAFKITREAIVKKGSEIGVANVAVKTVKRSRGVIARLKQLDAWLLQKIEKMTQ